VLAAALCVSRPLLRAQIGSKGRGFALSHSAVHGARIAQHRANTPPQFRPTASGWHPLCDPTAFLPRRSSLAADRLRVLRDAAALRAQAGGPPHGRGGLVRALGRVRERADAGRVRAAAGGVGTEDVARHSTIVAAVAQMPRETPQATDRQPGCTGSAVQAVGYGHRRLPVESGGGPSGCVSAACPSWWS
jgi:hypothetical protein